MAAPSGWAYYKWINISNPLAGHVLTVKVIQGSGTDSGNTVYVSQARTDFADLRFTLPNGTSVNWYLSELIGTDTAICKVETPDGNLLLWYGKADAAPDTNPPAVGTFSHDFRGPRQHLITGQYVDSITQYTTWQTSTWQNGIITRNGVTYLAWWEWNSSRLIIKGCTFTHATRAYTPAIQIFNEAEDGAGADNHCPPALTIDASGDFHIFAASHNGQLKYRTATSFAGLATASTQNVVASGVNVSYATYVAAFCSGDDVFCFFRGHNYSSTVALQRYGFIRRPSGSSTWTWTTVLGNTYSPAGVTLDRRSYASVYFDGTNIHMAIFGQTEAATTEAAYHGVYYLYSPDLGVTWKTVDDALSYTTGAFPILHDTATAWDTKLAPYILPYSTTSVRAMAVRTTADGRPVVLYTVVANPTTVPVLFADTDMWVAEWTGTAWAKHAITSGGKWEHHCDLSIIDSDWKFVGMQQNANGKLALKILSATSPTQTSDWDNATAPFIDGGNAVNSHMMEPEWELYTDNPTYRQIMYTSTNDASGSGLHGSVLHYRYSESADYGAWTGYQLNEEMTASNWLFNGVSGTGVIRTVRDGSNMYLSSPAISSTPADVALDVDFSVSSAVTGGTAYIGLTNAAGNLTAIASPGDGLRLDLASVNSSTATVRGRHILDGVGQATGQVTIPVNTPCYATLRTTDSGRAARLTVYSDPQRTTAIGTVTSARNTGALPTDLSYLTVSNDSTTSGGALQATLYGLSAYPTATTPPSITGWSLPITGDTPLDETPPTVVLTVTEPAVDQNVVTIAVNGSDSESGVAGYYVLSGATSQAGADVSTALFTAKNNWTSVAFTPPDSYPATRYICAWAKDNAGNISDAPDEKTVTLTSSAPSGDTNPPVITEFSIPTTAAVKEYVEITSFVATDEVGVTGYYLSESPTAPTISSTGWQFVTSATTWTASGLTYTFAGTGLRTLYAWTRDAAGNISASSSDTVEITPVATTVDTQAVIDAITAAIVAAVETILRGDLAEEYADPKAPTTLTKAIYMLLQLAGEKTITGTTMTVRRLDGTTPAMTFQLDSSTDPKSITRIS